MNTKIFGTLGPSCCNRNTLKRMIDEGMSGIRLNLSHVSLGDSAEWLKEWQQASEGKLDLLIDMQGPEMRIGRIADPISFEKGEHITIPVTKRVIPFLDVGQEILLDDGKYRANVLEVSDEFITIKMENGGTLSSSKSIKIPGVKNTLSALTGHDIKNISLAKDAGVTGVMQPFVRGASDLIEVREALDKAGASHIKIFAKIENRTGMAELKDIIPCSDWIVIARGDLGNDMPLWELPGAQRRIASECQKAGIPYIVVTQMLASMEHSPVPTRAEVSDIYYAVTQGAGGVMVTGETAAGEYPVEVIRNLTNTVRCGEI